MIRILLGIAILAMIFYFLGMFFLQTAAVFVALFFIISLIKVTLNETKKITKKSHKTWFPF